MKEITVYAVSTETMRRMDLTTLEAAMPKRADRARRFRREQDRLLCLGAGYLMLRALGIRSESQILLGENGKPSAPGFPPFSISHSGSWCILASCAQGTIGADIEEIKEAPLDVAPAVYTPEELAWMAEDPVNRFFRLWTWKESVLKATGLGLSLEPRSFQVLPFADRQPLLLRGATWYAADGGMPGYRFSVCADEPVEMTRWIEYGMSPRSARERICCGQDDGLAVNSVHETDFVRERASESVPNSSSG